MDERQKDVSKKLTDFVYWVITGLLVLFITEISKPKEEIKFVLYGILLLLALFIWWAYGARMRRHETQRKSDERQEQMLSEIRSGFNNLSGRVDNLQIAQAATMRTQLIHYAEKYFERGWFTTEEHQSWHEMHEQYSAIVEKNGFIDTYKKKLDELPEKELDAIIDEYERMNQF